MTHHQDMENILKLITPASFRENYRENGAWDPYYPPKDAIKHIPHKIMKVLWKLDKKWTQTPPIISSMPIFKTHKTKRIKNALFLV